MKYRITFHILPPLWEYIMIFDTFLFDFQILLNNYLCSLMKNYAGIPDDWLSSFITITAYKISN